MTTKFIPLFRFDFSNSFGTSRFLHFTLGASDTVKPATPLVAPSAPLVPFCCPEAFLEAFLPKPYQYPGLVTRPIMLESNLLLAH